MATLTAEQIEQKKQQLKQLTEEVKALTNELVEAGAMEIPEDDLDEATGGGIPRPRPKEEHLEIPKPIINPELV